MENETSDATIADSTDRVDPADAIAFDAPTTAAIEYAASLPCPEGMPNAAHCVLKSIYMLEKAAVGLLARAGVVESNSPKEVYYAISDVSRLRPVCGIARGDSENISTDLLPPPAIVWASIADALKPKETTLDLAEHTWRTRLSSPNGRATVLVSSRVLAEVGGVTLAYVSGDSSVTVDNAKWTLREFRKGVVAANAPPRKKRTREDTDRAHAEKKTRVHNSTTPAHPPPTMQPVDAVNAHGACVPIKDILDIVRAGGGTSVSMQLFGFPVNIFV